MAAPMVTLNNGIQIPALGLGTWLAAAGEVSEVVKTAVNVGYRLFDCAWVYGNEKEIGEGLKAKIEDGTVKREELFVVTKLWNIFHQEHQVLPAFEESLKNFGLDYIDCYLIHWPCAQKIVSKIDNKFPFSNACNDDYDFLKTWKAMEKLVTMGLVRSIGLSNFNIQQIERIMQNCTIKPVLNQVEITPFLNQKELIKFSRKLGIEIMAYSPLGSPTRSWAKPTDPKVPLNDPKLLNIGEKYKKTGAQVILRYVYQLGTIPIPKTSSLQRLKENIDIFDFQLTAKEISIIDEFNCGIRVVSAPELASNVEYPFKYTT